MNYETNFHKKLFGERLSKIMVEKGLINKKGNPDHFQLYNLMRPEEPPITPDFIRLNGKTACNDIARTYFNWIKGVSVPNITEIARLCQALGCSADYLLGFIDCKNHDSQFIHDKTGLSEKTIDTIIQWNHSESREKHWTTYLSKIIEHENSDEIMGRISDLMCAAMSERLDVLSGDYIEADRDIANADACVFRISHSLTNILDDMYEAERNKETKLDKRAKEIGKEIP